MTKKVGGLFLLSLILFLFFFPLKTSLCIRQKNGELIRYYDLKHQDYFQIEFCHSVNKGLIKERYSIDFSSCDFYLKTAWFESYGAGMLDSVPEDVVIQEEGSFLRLDFPVKRLKYIAYAAAGIANHKIIVGSDEIELFNINPYKTSFITVEKMSIFDQIFMR